METKPIKHGINPRGVYHWLSDAEYDVCLSRTYVPVYESEVDKVYLEQINKEVDLVCPVSETGWRCSDIETLKRTDNPVLQQKIINSMSQKVTDYDTTNISDDEIADMVVPRNLNMSTISLLADSLSISRDEVDESVSTPGPVPTSSPDVGSSVPDA